MPTKDRLLVLLQTLQEQSDDETWLTTADIRKALEKEGHECSIRTLRRDVKSLHNCGYDIAVREADGKYTTYAYMGREWSKPELQILIDAVSAAQFIPQERSTKLIHKLSKMAGPSHEAELRPQILVSEHVKAKSQDMIYSVQAIRKAIDRNKKIMFRYLQYNERKEQVPKHEGTPEEFYVISPYATVWNNDRYYLVGIRDYTDKIFKMYGGQEEKVTLRCKKSILDQVIDRFGDGITLENIKEDDFTVTVPVSLSTTFYAWVFQYVGKMKITAPKYVRKAYAGYLKQALKEE